MARVRLLKPEDVRPPHRAFVEGLNAGGGFINLYRAMAHSPEALSRFCGLLSCLWDAALDARTREIAIISAAAASNAAYPLGWHILDGRDAGLTTSEIQAIIAGTDDEVLSQRETAVARFARSLALDASVNDADFRAVEDYLSDQQIVELTMLAGMYRMVACIANALNVELDDAAADALNDVSS